jgi:hypothetical protein
MVRMTPDEAIKEIERQLSGSMGRATPINAPADFTTGGDGATRRAPEVLPPLRDKTGAERKLEPIYSGVLKYFPDALAAVARVSKAGNDKHNPGQPLHWSRSKSADHMDCATRHGLTPDYIDLETGEPELANAAWRILAELQLLEERRNRERGIRSYSGVE